MKNMLKKWIDVAKQHWGKAFAGLALITTLQSCEFKYWDGTMWDGTKEQIVLAESYRTIFNNNFNNAYKENQEKIMYVSENNPILLWEINGTKYTITEKDEYGWFVVRGENSWNTVIYKIWLDHPISANSVWKINPLWWSRDSANNAAEIYKDFSELIATADFTFTPEDYTGKWLNEKNHTIANRRKR